MRQIITGLIHARGLHYYFATMLLFCAVLWFAYDPYVAVQPNVNEIRRSISAFEAVIVLLAGITPSITTSRFGAATRLEVVRARVVNALVTAGCALGIVVALPIWMAALNFSDRFSPLPSAWGYVGTVFLIATLGQVLYWWGGTLVALCGTPSLWLGFVFAQQAWPQAHPFIDVARSDRWSTHWSVTVAALVIIGAISWFGQSLPRNVR